MTSAGVCKRSGTRTRESMVMRIAYVCADRGIAVDGNSGSSIHVREMVRALAARGEEPTVFAASSGRIGGTEVPVVDIGGDPQLTELRARTAKALRASGREATRAAEIYSLMLNQTLLVSLASAARFDLVYERQSLWSLAGLQYARRERIPFFLEVNAPLADQQREYRELELEEVAVAVEALLFEQADRIFVTTGSLVEYVHARGGSRSKVRVLPCGAASHLFARRNAPREPHGETFVVGFLGTLKPWHGTDVLLDAFALLREQRPGYRLLIVGDGPLRGEIEKACRERGFADAVTMTGSVDHADVGRHLAAMDVGVASYPELASFYFSPLKVWEYAAASVPIAASASGELPALFPHKTASLLHPPGNARKLARHIERLRDNPDLALRLARNAHRVARAHTWDRLAARIVRAAEPFARARPVTPQ